MSEQLVRSNCSTSLSNCWFMPSVFGQAKFESTKIPLFGHIRGQSVDYWEGMMWKQNTVTYFRTPDQPHTPCQDIQEVILNLSSRSRIAAWLNGAFRTVEGNGRVLRNVIYLNLCDETVQNQGMSDSTSGPRGDKRLPVCVMEKWEGGGGVRVDCKQRSIYRPTNY
jgi:hypothetical protein